jgi:very-short-patch-repair endonuclease
VSKEKGKRNSSPLSRKKSLAAKRQWAEKREVMIASMNRPSELERKRIATTAQWANPKARKERIKQIRKAWSEPILRQQQSGRTTKLWRKDRGKMMSGLDKWFSTKKARHHLASATQASSRVVESNAERKVQKILRSMGIPFLAHEILLHRYVADVYLPKWKAVIECDGSGHSFWGQKQHDALRDRRMNGSGVIVVRLSNAKIHKDPQGTVRSALEIIRKKRKVK